MMKKIRLMIALVVGLLCLAVFACAGADIPGWFVNWSLDPVTGVMTVSYLDEEGFWDDQWHPWYSDDHQDQLRIAIIEEGVTYIQDFAFNQCTNLTNVVIPQSVTSIGRSAFQSCSSLKSISIPQGVTSIEGDAFSECSNLINISIPQSVTSIGQGAFFGCTSLTSISIPQGVTSIDRWTFDGCTSLTSISIPQGVTTIGQGAFYRSGSRPYKILIPDSVTVFGDECLGDSRTTTIYCNRYSPAQFYAEDNGFKVVFLDDVNFKDIASVSLAGCNPAITVGTSRRLTPSIFPLLDDLSITWQSSAPRCDLRG